MEVLKGFGFADPRHVLLLYKRNEKYIHFRTQNKSVPAGILAREGLATSALVYACCGTGFSAKQFYVVRGHLAGVLSLLLPCGS